MAQASDLAMVTDLAMVKVLGPVSGPDLGLGQAKWKDPVMVKG